jgi:predicted PurR-regulated permease PerM
MTKQGNRVRDDGAENGGENLHFRSPVITTCLVVIALCIGGYTFSYLKAVLSPLLIALFIFFLTNPIVRFFRARNYSPTFSYFIVLLMTVVAFLGLGRVFFGSLQEVTDRLPKYRSNVNRVVENISRPIMQTIEYFRSGPEKPSEDEPPASTASDEKVESNESGNPAPGGADSGESQAPVSEADAKINQVIGGLERLIRELRGEKGPSPSVEIKNEQQRFVNMLTRFFSDGASELINGVIGTSLEFLEISVMTVFYLFFILVEAHKLPHRIRRGFAYESTQNLMEMGISIQRSIEQYLRVKTGVSFGLGLTTGLIGMLFGLDFWLLWAGFMFLSNYVTYIGSMVALAPPIAIAFLQFDSLFGAIVLTILLIANRFFWIDYAEIKLSGRQLNVSPVILLLSIGLFGALWGVIGMVLAVPVVTSVKIALAQFDSTTHLASLLSED